MDASRREEILRAYARHAKRFDDLARRSHHPTGLFPASERSGGGPEVEPPQQPIELTERQRDVLLLVAAGLSNHEIGTKLHLGDETIKSHVRHVLHNLGARNRGQAVSNAYSRGLIG